MQCFWAAADSRTRRIAQGRARYKDARADQAQAEDAKQGRPPRGASATVQRAPQPQCEADAEYAADEEVGDLLPALVAEAELAAEVTPGVVARARRALDQQDDNEKQWANQAPREEQPGYPLTVENAVAPRQRCPGCRRLRCHGCCSCSTSSWGGPRCSWFKYDPRRRVCHRSAGGLRVGLWADGRVAEGAATCRAPPWVPSRLLDEEAGGGSASLS